MNGAGLVDIISLQALFAGPCLLDFVVFRDGGTGKRHWTTALVLNGVAQLQVFS